MWFSDLNGIFRQIGQLIDKLRGIAIEKDFLADHDALTGLPNRQGLLEHLKKFNLHGAESIGDLLGQWCVRPTCVHPTWLRLFPAYGASC
uniref:Uncharacterized protein n=1 Tax=mine drainage metagenome TaxID=410659 RepID=E6PSD9_9ZZZZ